MLADEEIEKGLHSLKAGNNRNGEGKTALDLAIEAAAKKLHSLLENGDQLGEVSFRKNAHCQVLTSTDNIELTIAK